MTKPSDKIRVAVLYGGRSAEHEVSLKSAANVIQYLDQSRFEIIPIGIDKQGNWFLGYDIFVKSLQYNKVPQLTDNIKTWFTPEWVSKTMEKQDVKNIITQRPNGVLFDVVFPVVHGAMCEDGSLQGLLELANLPYVGAGVLSSAIGMDKDVSKRLAANAGIPVAPYIVLRHEEWQANPEQLIRRVEEKLTYPVFVKPANTGSSIGITKVTVADKLQAAIDNAFCFDTKILVEKGLQVTELEIAVLESLEKNKDPIVSIVGEIRPTQHEFYSYKAKYSDENGTELLIPAPITDENKKRARFIAKQLFQILECEGMARVDLFLDKETQQIFFNEINTIPGFTQISMYPKLMEASGISYSDLLTHLIQLAIKRYKNKSLLERSYSD